MNPERVRSLDPTPSGLIFLNGVGHPGLRGEAPLTLGWNLSLLRSEDDSIA